MNINLVHKRNGCIMIWYCFEFSNSDLFTLRRMKIYGNDIVLACSVYVSRKSISLEYQ